MVIVTDIKQLGKPTELVEEGEDISEVVENLFREIKEFNGVGLSANQLGYDKQIFVMRMDPLPPICVVNPVVTKVRGSQISEEGCLSIPSKFIKVKRPQQVTVKGLNQYFKPVRYKMSGLRARIVCHEVDHLTGKLIIDHEEVK